MAGKHSQNSTERNCFMTFPQNLKNLFGSQKSKQEIPKTKVKILDRPQNYRDILGSLVSQKLNWQLFAMGSWLVSFIAVGGMVYVATQVKIVPYLVEVPTNHIPVALGTISTPSPVNDAIIEATLAQWIEDIRTVSPDKTLERSITKRLYSHLLTGTPAHTKIQEIFASDLRPEIRGLNTIVDINITSVLKESPSTWQIDWTEIVRARNGQIKQQFKMKALITVEIIPPVSSGNEENLLLNPLGIFIPSFSWSRAS
ncbi:conjugal transfer protein TrbF [Acetobacteraceae bacterium]|nr:conjugal transfer protein TrbF [Acetobacteraceae bacterium]